MILWRISNYETLDGSGGMKASGRWHTQGRRVVYLSSSPSSALLEILVHLEISTGDVPRTYRLLEILVPPNMVIQRLRDLTQLPEDWVKNQFITQQLGDSWLARNSAALLEVPSALVPHTSNFLMNPRHPDAAGITIKSVSEHRIDERFFYS